MEELVVAQMFIIWIFKEIGKDNRAEKYHNKIYKCVNDEKNTTL